MPPVFRIFALLCVAATIMNMFYGFVNNMLYAAQVAQPYQSNFNPVVAQENSEFINYTAWSALSSTNRMASPKKKSNAAITQKLQSNSEKEDAAWIQFLSRNYTIGKANVCSRNNNVSKAKASSMNNSVSEKNNGTTSKLYNATDDDDITSIVEILYSDINQIDVTKTFPDVHKGGWYSPRHDSLLQSVAIIVPYRDRPMHLAIFLKFMHKFLMKQQMEYGIFIIEQEGTGPFNRGKLLNVGFVESQKMGKWKCFVFHDVDLLPLNHQIQYQCGPQPRHLSVAVDAFRLNFNRLYNTLFGGVSALTQKQFEGANGFANRYWGWGGEDYDLYRRLWALNYRIQRENASIYRYVMLDHRRTIPNPRWQKLLINASKFFKEDGLSSLKYTVTTIVWHTLHTRIVANIDETSDIENYGKKMIGDDN